MRTWVSNWDSMELIMHVYLSPMSKCLVLLCLTGSQTSMKKESSFVIFQREAIDSLRLLIVFYLVVSASQPCVFQAPRQSCGTLSATHSKGLPLVSLENLTHPSCPTNYSRTLCYLTLHAQSFTTLGITVQRISLLILKATSQNKCAFSALLNV